MQTMTEDNHQHRNSNTSTPGKFNAEKSCYLAESKPKNLIQVNLVDALGAVRQVDRAVQVVLQLAKAQRDDGR
jgi:hypothetical protein